MTKYDTGYIIVTRNTLRGNWTVKIMLNIKNILTNKGISTKAFSEFLGTSEKTAYNKLMGITDFTYPEAVKILEGLLPEYNARFLFSEFKGTV